MLVRELTEDAYSIVLNAMDLATINKIAEDWSDGRATVISCLIRQEMSAAILRITESNSHPGGG